MEIEGQEAREAIMARSRSLDVALPRGHTLSQGKKTPPLFREKTSLTHTFTQDSTSQAARADMTVADRAYTSSGIANPSFHLRRSALRLRVYTQKC